MVLEDFLAVVSAPLVDLLTPDEALQRLSEEDLVKSEFVKLRFFAGLTVQEAAGALGISRATRIVIEGKTEKIGFFVRRRTAAFRAGSLDEGSWQGLPDESQQIDEIFLDRTMPLCFNCQSPDFLPGSTIHPTLRTIPCLRFDCPISVWR